MDVVAGAGGDDTLSGLIDDRGSDPDVSTLTALDSIDGGAGTDVLNINAITAVTALPAVTVSSIETVNIRAAAAFKGSAAGFTALNTANVTSAAAALELTAATTTAVNVSGASDTVTLNGGAAISVTHAAAGKGIIIGATTVNAGDISVTSTKMAAQSIAVDGGTKVTIVATGSSGGGDTITVGQGGASTDLPSGAVSITSNHTGVAATDVTLNGITVSGGSSVTVTQTADTSKAATDTTGATLTQGAVAVTAGAATTSVSVTQAATVAKVKAETAVAGVTETASVKFGALAANDVLIIGGNGDTTLDAGEIQFKAAKAMTAAQVAAVVANLTVGTLPVAGDTQGSGLASLGTYTTSATTSAFTGWTSGAVSTDTVVFTSTTASSNVTDLAFKLTGTGTAPTVTTTAGSAATAAKTGVLGVNTGAVTINDAATAVIATISVDGYANSTIGGTAATTALSSLTLKRADSGASMTVTKSAATLGLTVESMGSSTTDAVLTFTTAPTTLNVTSTGTNYVNLTAAATTALTVAGTGVFDADATDLAALKTVSVSGAAGVKLNAGIADTVTSVDTSAATGTSTLTIDGAKATYTGGAGVDSVTLATSTALTKAISLDAGDDTLSFGSLAVTGSTAAVSGGDGVDTLSMTVAAADGLDAVAQTFYTGFERLTLNNAGSGGETIDLANLGFTSYVTTTGSGGTLTLNNLVSTGTVVITTAPTAGYTVGIKDASTGTADVFNATLSSGTSLAAGVLTVADVETINLTSTDTDTSSANANSVTLTAAAATTVSVAGNAALTLTMTGSTKVTSINGSTATGAITVTSLNTTSATTITGGSAGDSLTAATGTTADVLNGGGGNDKLTSNSGLTSLTGGTGADLFVIGSSSANSSVYTTITDFTSSDLIQLSGVDTFSSTAVALADTAVFQDYVNAALTLLSTAGGTVDAAGWFQFGGNTYIVMDVKTTESTTSFVGSEDVIVRLSGLIDLSNATFNATHGTIGLAG